MKNGGGKLEVLVLEEKINLNSGKITNESLGTTFLET